MKAVIQRVKEARVSVQNQLVSAIGKGLLVLVGVARDDTEQDAEHLAKKLAGLRIFNDQHGKMNLCLFEVKGEILLVSQFTLLGDVKRGKRPSFDEAAGPQQAKVLYQYLIEKLKGLGILPKTGKFAAMMDVHLVNDGPVTIIIDTKE